MSSLIFPYKTIKGKINLSIDGTIKMGGPDGLSELDSELIDEEAKRIDIQDEVLGSDSKFLQIPLQIKASPKDIKDLDGDLSIMIVAKCPTTRLRQSINPDVIRPDLGIWKGVIKLDLINFKQAINVMGILSGSAMDLSDRFFGKTEVWTIYLDDMAKPVGRGALPVLWIDFTNSEEHYYLRSYRNEPYYLNLSENPPELYLNSAFEGLPELFPDEGRPIGPLLPLHESTRIGIAKAVWLELFQVAVTGIRDPDIEDTDEEPQWPEKQWQVDVLKQILPKIKTEVDMDEACLLYTSPSPRDRS